MKATDLLVKALEKERVKYIFGVPGVPEVVQRLYGTCLVVGTTAVVAALQLAYYLVVHKHAVCMNNNSYISNLKHSQTDFCMTGEENLDFVESLRKSKIKLVVTRHEMAAGMMAATVGRLTGDISSPHKQVLSFWTKVLVVSSQM